MSIVECGLYGVYAVLTGASIGAVFWGVVLMRRSLGRALDMSGKAESERDDI